MNIKNVQVRFITQKRWELGGALKSSSFGDHLRKRQKAYKLTFIIITISLGLFRQCFKVISSHLFEGV